MTILFAVLLLIVLLGLFVCAVLFRFLIKVSKNRDHLLGSARRPTLSADFVATSPARFRIPYKLTWRAERLNPIEFLREWTFMKDIQAAFAQKFNSLFFLPALEKNSIQFRIALNHERAEWSSGECYGTLVKREEMDEQRCHELPAKRLIEAIRPEPVEIGGCRFTICGFELNPITDELIEENYAMLTNDDRRKAESDKAFEEYDEKLAVALLKRRLDFFRDQSKQVHEGGMVSLRTERAGSGLRISWTFHSEAKSGYDLLGFKKTGGFFADGFDEKSNGLLVIDSSRSGETIDSLKEGESYFYTFILKPWPNTRNESRYSIARFQVTMATEKEMEAVATMIRRIEERNRVDPDKRIISQAMKELGLFVEFDTAMEATKRKLAEQVRKSDYSEEEKAEKIARLDDFVATLRTKYEP